MAEDTMDAIILGGGFATRLEPIGEFIPKPLLTLNGKPLIDYIISDLEDVEAIDRVIISTNKRFEDQFNYWISLKKAAGFKKEIMLIAEPTMNDGEKFGAIKGIAYAIKEAKVNDDAIVVFGDNFYTFDLAAFLEEINMFNKILKPGLLAYDIGSIESAKRFGVLVVKDGKVFDVEEKPANPSSSLVMTGIYFFPKKAVGYFEKYISSGGKTDGMGFFIKWLITQTEVQAITPTKGEWFDIGTLDSYKQLFHGQKEKKD